MTPEAACAIQARGLRKSYGTLQVLTGVDLEIQQGQIYALLGSNGAGKTTIVRILSTLLRPDAGTACVAGFDIIKEPERVRSKISLTGQFAAVDQILTGRENLILTARLRHLRRPRALAGDLLIRFGLTEAADARVATYSGGMRRRLDVAMSLVGEPAVVFLDEPTTGLDPQSRIEVWACIRDLAGKGTSVLLTTQYLEEAEQLADHIGILHGGTLIANGTLGELKRLLPAPKVEYIEKQPTLEEIFLSIVGQQPSLGAHGNDAESRGTT